MSTFSNMEIRCQWFEDMGGICVTLEREILGMDYSHAKPFPCNSGGIDNVS